MKIYNSKDFGSQLKQRRKQYKYTQKDVSKFLGVSASFISDLENGKKSIELDKAIQVATILGIDITMTDR